MPDLTTRHVVVALNRLTTQVRRIADAMPTPVVAEQTTPIRAVNLRNTGWYWECPACGSVSGTFSTEQRALKVGQDEHPKCPPDPDGPWAWTAPTTPVADAQTTPDGAACRRMETRTCPPSYNGPCGERPCARFESDNPAPWGPTVGHVKVWSDLIPMTEHAIKEMTEDARVLNDYINSALPPRITADTITDDQLDALVKRAEQAKAANGEAQQVIEIQKRLIGAERRIVITAMGCREDQGTKIEYCDHCGRDHMAELDEAIQAADLAYAKAFPATADGPARPGRLPDDGPSSPVTTPDDTPTTTAAIPRCVCGAPIQPHGDPMSWIHSPGSGDVCPNARPNV